MNFPSLIDKSIPCGATLVYTYTYTTLGAIPLHFTITFHIT